MQIAGVPGQAPDPGLRLVAAADAALGKSLQQAGVSPDVVTGLGVTMAGACGVAIALGQFPLAVLLLLAALVSGALWVAGTLLTLGGSYWSDLFYRHESLLPAAVAAIALAA